MAGVNMADTIISVDTGGTGDYTSLNAALAAEATTVDSGDRYIFEVEDSTGVTPDTVVVTGSHAWSGDGEVVIQAKSGHEALKSGYDSTRYVHYVSGEDGFTVLTGIKTTISGIQIRQSGYYIALGCRGASSYDCTIENCRIVSDSANGYGIYVSETTRNVYISNNVFDGFTQGYMYLQTQFPMSIIMIF